MPESPSFDDELVITSPWSGDLLVAEMEAHGQLIVRGSHRSQQVALRTLQAHYGEREVGVRTVHDKLGMELTVVVSNPGFSGAHRCFMVPVAAAKELYGTQETAAGAALAAGERTAAEAPA